MFPSSWKGFSLVAQDVFKTDLDDREAQACTGKCYRDQPQQNLMLPRPNLGIWDWSSTASPFVGISAPAIGDPLYRYEDPVTGVPGATGEISALVGQYDGNPSSGNMNLLFGTIDTFVCWLWNRWLDHGYCRLRLP
jgi:hypothetical protein